MRKHPGKLLDLVRWGREGVRRDLWRVGLIVLRANLLDNTHKEPQRQRFWVLDPSTFVVVT